MINTVVLVSGAQESDSVIHRFVSILLQNLLFRLENVELWSCAIQVLVSYLL